MGEEVLRRDWQYNGHQQKTDKRTKIIYRPIHNNGGKYRCCGRVSSSYSDSGTCRVTQFIFWQWHLSCYSVHILTVTPVVLLSSYSDSDTCRVTQFIFWQWHLSCYSVHILTVAPVVLLSSYSDSDTCRVTQFIFWQWHLSCYSVHILTVAPVVLLLNDTNIIWYENRARRQYS
jgi:hypothetical protein